MKRVSFVATGAPSPVAAQPRPPLCTYRLQFREGLTLRRAAALVPYLHSLGITHVYASPILHARPGSTHGYDVVDPAAIDPALGTERDLDAFVKALRRRSMSWIVDIVPNHVGVGSDGSETWLDVLEKGRASPFAANFDIEWDSGPPDHRGKVTVPILGDPLDVVLDRKELTLDFEPARGALVVRYFEHRLPVARRAYAAILSSTLARLAARARRSPSHVRALRRAARSVPVTPEILHLQHWRLVHWRRAAAEINYRRFFDVNELAAIRQERPGVFERSHAAVLRWIEEGKLDGLRVDHVDGLADPAAYLRRLRARIGPHAYLVVEKILAAGEDVPAAWPVDGTTGYEFQRLVNGLFVDPRGSRELLRAYRRFTGAEARFEIVEHTCKRRVLDTLFPGEIERLAAQLGAIAAEHAPQRAVAGEELREALTEIAACFPVYRSYVTARGASDEDRRRIGQACQRARALGPGIARATRPALELVRDALTLELAEGRPSSTRGRLLRIARRFQQLTAAVTAKGVEDTAFYRYLPLLSTNEVGGDPRHPVTTVEEFHRANATRLARMPHSMLASSTHDSKRGEDARARIDVLSEIPAEWSARVARWARLADRHASRASSGARSGQPRVPTRNDEYLVYQTLIGAWPAELVERAPRAAELAAFRARVGGYLVKAVREGKLTSSWLDPDLAYEKGLLAFLDALFATPRSPFLADFRRFERRIARAGMVTSLAQLVLKLTAPGVPDTYQGAELWNLALVDPDNRRPVDFDARRELLAQLDRRYPDGRAVPRAALRRMLTDMASGAAKLHVTARLARFRREHRALLLEGDYVPLAVRGRRANHLLAFARTDGDVRVIVAVPRLTSGLAARGSAAPLGRTLWGDTGVVLPDTMPERPYRDLFTGAELRPHRTRGRTILRAAELLAAWPVAAISS